MHLVRVSAMDDACSYERSNIPVDELSEAHREWFNVPQEGMRASQRYLVCRLQELDDGCRARFGEGGIQGTFEGPGMRDALQQLPGIGPSMAADLRRLGVRSVRDLARRDPERLYAKLCKLTSTRQDPCVLYTFRCAVYAARTEKLKPELLKWWNWKRRTLARP